MFLQLQHQGTCFSLAEGWSCSQLLGIAAGHSTTDPWFSQPYKGSLKGESLRCYPLPLPYACLQAASRHCSLPEKGCISLPLKSTKRGGAWAHGGCPHRGEKHRPAPSPPKERCHKALLELSRNVSSNTPVAPAQWLSVLFPRVKAPGARRLLSPEIV